jgi:hypothetical protein
MRNVLLRVAQRLLAAGVLIGALAVPTAASAQSFTCCISTNPPLVSGPIQILNATQLVVNGGFEDPNALTPSGSPAWSLASGATYDVLSPMFVVKPHCRMSPGAMYLQGFSGAGPLTQVQDAGRITQTLTVPAGSSGAGTTLEYFLYFPNQLTEHEELVARAVNVANLPDPFSTTPWPWVNLATTSNQTTSKNAWIHIGPLSMSQFAGQTIRLQFLARTDQQYPEPSQAHPVVTDPGIFMDDVAMWTPGNRPLTACF